MLKIWTHLSHVDKHDLTIHQSDLCIFMGRGQFACLMLQKEFRKTLLSNYCIWYIQLYIFRIFLCFYRSVTLEICYV